MKVIVNESCIKNGERESYSMCPVALAVQSLTGLYCEVNTGNYVGWVIIELGPKEGDNCVSFELSHKAKKKIEAFDEGGEMKPFTLQLDEDLFSPCDAGADTETLRKQLRDIIRSKRHTERHTPRKNRQNHPE